MEPTVHEQKLMSERVGIPRPLSIRQNFLVTLAGNFFSAACNWLTLSALARIGSAEVLGQYSLGIAIANPAVSLAHMELRALVTSDAKEEFRFQEYFGLGTITLSLSYVVILCIAFAGRDSLQDSLVIAFVGLSETLICLSWITFGLFQRRERLDRLTVSLVLRGLLALVAAAGGLYLTGSLVWAALGLVITQVVILLAYDLPTCSSLLGQGTPPTPSAFPAKPSLGEMVSWDRKRLIPLFWLALPAGITVLLNMIKQNTSSYFVAGILGNHELGIFAASFSFIGAGQRVFSAFSFSISAQLARSFSIGDMRRFLQLLSKLFIVGLVLGVGGLLVGIVVGKELLTLVFGAEFGQHQEVLLWLLAASGVNFIAVGGIALTSARYLKIQIPLAIIGIASSAFFNWLLVPHGGVLGAAQATFIVSVISFLANIAVLAWVVRIQWRLRQG